MVKSRTVLCLLSLTLLLLLLVILNSVILCKSNNERIQSLAEEITTKDLLIKNYKEEVSLLKKNNVRIKDVKTIIEYKYVNRDSMVYRDTLIYVYDTVIKMLTAPFHIDAKCVSIDGNVLEGVVEVTAVQSQDSLLFSLYKGKRRCILKPREYKAVCISYCTGDTLAVLKSLHIK